MATVQQLPTDRGVVRVLTSDRDDGDLHLERVPADVLEQRRRRLVDLPWTMLDERHGTTVVHVSEPGGGDRRIGDVAVVTAPGAVLGVWVGDCAPVVLVRRDGVFAGVHAGWKGLAAGVLDVAVAALDGAAGGDVRAVLGPCIHPCCYEFGAEELALVADGVGVDRAAVAGRTRRGTPALDVPAAVRAGLARHRIDVVTTGCCTGCDERWFSHRVRADPGRHVVAAWLEEVA